MIRISAASRCRHGTNGQADHRRRPARDGCVSRRRRVEPAGRGRARAITGARRGVAARSATLSSAAPLPPTRAGRAAAGSRAGRRGRWSRPSRRGRRRSASSSAGAGRASPLRADDPLEDDAVAVGTLFVRCCCSTYSVERARRASRERGRLGVSLRDRGDVDEREGDPFSRDDRLAMISPSIGPDRRISRRTGSLVASSA